MSRPDPYAAGPYRIHHHGDSKQCPEVAGGLWSRCHGHIETSDVGVTLAEAKAILDAAMPKPRRRKHRPSLARNVDYIDRFGDES